MGFEADKKEGKVNKGEGIKEEEERMVWWRIPTKLRRNQSIK